MEMAKAAAKLISDNLRYPDGSKVECVIEARDGEGPSEGREERHHPPAQLGLLLP